jgi:hypothetical protein
MFDCELKSLALLFYAQVTFDEQIQGAKCKRGSKKKGVDV